MMLIPGQKAHSRSKILYRKLNFISKKIIYRYLIYIYIYITIVI
jgi:hypothetical protein